MDDEEKEGSRKETKTTNGGHVVACFMLGAVLNRRSNVLYYSMIRTIRLQYTVRTV